MCLTGGHDTAWSPACVGAYVVASPCPKPMDGRLIAFLSLECSKCRSTRSATGHVAVEDLLLFKPCHEIRMDLEIEGVLCKVLRAFIVLHNYSPSGCYGQEFPESVRAPQAQHLEPALQAHLEP